MLLAAVKLLVPGLDNRLCCIVLFWRQRRRRPSQVCRLDLLWKALAQDLQRGHTTHCSIVRLVDSSMSRDRVPPFRLQARCAVTMPFSSSTTPDNTRPGRKGAGR